jgi:hypothetical protein
MIDVGSHVVCINDDPKSFEVPGVAYNKGGFGALKKGKVYTVRGVFRNPRTRDWNLYLSEIQRPIWKKFGIEAGYNINRFRPLKKLKIEDFIEVKVKEPC